MNAVTHSRFDLGSPNVFLFSIASESRSRPGADSSVSTKLVEGGNVVWQTKQVREDRDKAVFGEITYDFTEKFSGTLGARYFDYENSLYGFNGFLRHCTGQYIDGEFVEIPADEGGEIQYPCFDTRILDDVAKGDDWAFKGNLEYRIDDDTLIYATYSQGFRAGVEKAAVHLLVLALQGRRLAGEILETVGGGIHVRFRRLRDRLAGGQYHH